jgi:hypothetical protein
MRANHRTIPAALPNTMTLDDAQKQTVARWLDEGLKLAEIQSRLASEFGLRMTYMDVRFLVDEPEKPTEPAEPAPPEGEDALPAEDDLSDEAPPAGTGKVSVTVDQLARPGALVSGKVSFSDGQTAQWHLDQFGRLGLVPPKEGYKPSQEDLMEFQRGLQTELARMGF